MMKKKYEILLNKEYLYPILVIVDVSKSQKIEYLYHQVVKAAKLGLKAENGT